MVRFGTMGAQHGEAIRIGVQEPQGARDRMAHENVAALVFLKGIGTAPDQAPRFLLAEPQLLADAPDRFGLEQTLRLGLEAVRASSVR